jgi:N4-gp56 family major capsid protein
MLYRPRKAQIFYSKGKKAYLPINGGNSISWRRFEAQSVPQPGQSAVTPLTESITPTASVITISEVTNTAKQFGNYVSISDQLADLAVDRLMNESVTALTQNAGETVESIVSNVLATGSNVAFPGAVVSRSGLTQSNVISLSLIRKLTYLLNGNNAPRFAASEEQERIGQGGYVLFAHPLLQNDLMNDSEIKNAFQYKSGDDKMWTGNLLSVYGVDIYLSTLCPVWYNASSDNHDVYGAILVAKDSFGVVDIAGKGEYELEVQDFGSAGTGDPLKQRATIGWKSYQMPTILNNAFMYRLEVCSSINRTGG